MTSGTASAWRARTAGSAECCTTFPKANRLLPTDPPAATAALTAVLSLAPDRNRAGVGAAERPALTFGAAD